jgi:hypothetical protein
MHNFLIFIVSIFDRADIPSGRAAALSRPPSLKMSAQAAPLSNGSRRLGQCQDTKLPKRRDVVSIDPASNRLTVL